MFFVLYIISFLIVMVYEDWFLVWLGLEINMISFIILIYCSKNMNCIEACMKYFFIQSVGSALFMLVYYCGVYEVGSLIVLILSYKLGAGPFFYWFLNLCEKINWVSCFYLMSFQSILPLYIMSGVKGKGMWEIMAFSLLVGCLGSFNQIKMKSMLGYSSIHHMGWMILSMVYESGLWFGYLMMYTLLIFPVIFYLDYHGVNSLMDMVKVDVGWVFVLSILSMGGMPPMLGFLIKLWFFYSLLWVNWLLLFFLIIVSVIMMYIYMRLVYNILLSGALNVSLDMTYIVSGISMLDLVILGSMILGVVMGVWFV